MPNSKAKYVAVFNIGDSGDEQVRINWSDLGLPAKCDVRDLWTHKDSGAAQDGKTFAVKPHASGFYRIAAAGDLTGYKAMQRLLGLKVRPDGVFCYNDPTAMGAMRAALEAGLRVPEDMAIMGCGNVTYAGFIRVPLTSVDQQSQTIGGTSAKLALDLLGKTPRRPKRVVLQPKLIKRESTARSPQPSL